MMLFSAAHPDSLYQEHSFSSSFSNSATLLDVFHAPYFANSHKTPTDVSDTTPALVAAMKDEEMKSPSAYRGTVKPRLGRGLIQEST